VFDKLPEFDDNSIESIVTDPPYNLKFMGKSWDDKGTPKEFQEWNEKWASIAYDKLKPGGWMVVFSGTKTYHRMVSGVEDAGFTIKDMIEWMYGTGFPKSYNIGQSLQKKLTTGRARRKDRDLGGLSRNRFSGSEEGKLIADTGGQVEITEDEAEEWQGWGTALKPAHEPLVLAQKPREGTYVNNTRKYGCGGLNIDECRVETDEEITNHSRSAEAAKSKGKYSDSSEQETHQTKGQQQGRFPANLVLSHHPDCEYQGSKEVEATSVRKDNTKEYDPDNEIKMQASEKVKRSGYADEDGKETVEDWDCVPQCPIRRMNEQSGETDGCKPHKLESNKEHDGWGSIQEKKGEMVGYEDDGGAARYFNQFHFRDEDFFKYTAKASKKERTCDGNVDNDHPTVKPLSLMRWLVRLVTPPEGVVLDPFAGSGTTLIAAYEQGFDYIGIDKNEKSVKITRERLDYHKGPKQKELL